jgi:RecA/RadA recombinase
MLVKSNAVGIVVVDSVAALVPSAELEGEMPKEGGGEGCPRKCPG